MEPWDLKETYALVEAAYGVQQQKLTQECARSVVDRQLFAQYHYRETLRLSRGFEKRHLNGKMLIDLHGLNSGSTRKAFEIYIVKAGAHVTAAVQCIHAIPDILAHVAYFASGQRTEFDALPEKKLGLPTVLRALKSNPAFSSVALILNAAQSGNYWHHLAAVGNTSKHRTVIRAALSEDWTGRRQHYRELQLSAFSRDGEHFPDISVRELLGSEFQRLSEIVVTLGHELNACLRAAG